MDLGPAHCRWPLRNLKETAFQGDQQFCGHKAARGAPYCLDHCRRAYPVLSGRSEAEALEYLARRPR